MAGPLGIMDIVSICKTIADYAGRYKDAPADFAEIKTKALSTVTVLRRIEKELLADGNIVKRDGPDAIRELEANLVSLKEDSKQLDSLVKRYAKIHDEGYGRRMLWALKESGNITDFRRKIGLHEQTLQLWYMTIMAGSLRRVEGGQADMQRGMQENHKEMMLDLAKLMELLKRLPREKRDQIRRSVINRDPEPLIQVMKAHGIGECTTSSPATRISGSGGRLNTLYSDNSDARQRRDDKKRYSSYAEASYAFRPDREDKRKSEDVADANFNKVLRAISDYVVADLPDKLEMEEEVHDSIAKADKEEALTGSPYASYESRTKSSSRDHSKLSPFPELYRSKSTGDERTRPSRDRTSHHDILGKPSQKVVFESSDSNLLRVPGDSYNRPRRLSENIYRVATPTLPPGNIYGVRDPAPPPGNIYQVIPRVPKSILVDRSEARPESSKRPDSSKRASTYHEPIIFVNEPNPKNPNITRERIIIRRGDNDDDRSSTAEDILVSGPPPPPRRQRSTSRHSTHSEANNNKRDTSRHSYVRERSSSRTRNGDVQKVYEIKKLDKMDRIDSMDVENGR